MDAWWAYNNLPSGEPYGWEHTDRGPSPWDNIDFHLDLGMGTLKKGRLGIDRHLAPGVDLVMNLETLAPAELPGGGFHPQTELTYEEAIAREDGSFLGLPFPDNSIDSIVSHHCLEHIDPGFLALMDECYRILEPGGVFRIIVPLFPSRTAVEDPDHKRYFLAGTFDTFVGRPGGHWHEDFSVPYTKCRFEIVDKWFTELVPPLTAEEMWGPRDARELRVALRKPEHAV